MSNIFNCYYVDDVVLVNLNNIPNDPAIIADIYESVSGINLDMISHSKPYRENLSIFFTVDSIDLPNVLKVAGGLKKIIPELRTEVSSGNCKYVLYSESLKTTSGVAAKLFRLLAENNIEIKLIVTSDVEIELLLDNSELNKIDKLLKKEFI